MLRGGPTGNRTKSTFVYKTVPLRVTAWGVEVQLYPFQTLAIDQGVVSLTRPFKEPLVFT